MTETGSNGRRVSEGLRDFARDIGVRVVHRWVEDGYSQAGQVSTGVLARHIEELHDKNRSGKKLTLQDQHLLTVLTDLKRELKQELDSAWNSYVSD